MGCVITALKGLLFCSQKSHHIRQCAKVPSKEKQKMNKLVALSLCLLLALVTLGATTEAMSVAERTSAAAAAGYDVPVGKAADDQIVGCSGFAGYCAGTWQCCGSMVCVSHACARY